MIGALATGLLVPAAAPAAKRKAPVVHTGKATNVGQATVTLNGTVDPNGTGGVSSFFQYGTTTLYGAETAAGTIDAGHGAVPVHADVGSLAPATRYHYRLVGQTADGRIVKGRDRTFKTARQPLGVSLAAAPNPVRSGRGAMLAGTLTGTGNDGRQVVLQANPWPYTQGFQTVSDVHLTGAQGSFRFPVLSVPVNTQYRVLMPERSEVVSPVVLLGTKVYVTTHLRVSHRTRRHGRVRVKGRLLPAVDGARVILQKKRGDTWRSIAQTTARHFSDSRSRYRIRVRQRRGGHYRILLPASGKHVQSKGKVARAKHVHR